MVRDYTPLDKLVESAVEQVAASTPYFHRSEVVARVLQHRNLARMLREIKSNYSGWRFDEIIQREMEHRIGQVLQKKDSNGIRVYECYAAGGGQRRWLRLRAMTADQLRVVMTATRTQERQLHLKGAGYEHFLHELEALGRPDATVDEVYDRAVPRIRRYRTATEF